MTPEDKMKQVQIDMEALAMSQITLTPEECVEAGNIESRHARQLIDQARDALRRSSFFYKLAKEMRPKLVVDNGEIPKETA